MVYTYGAGTDNLENNNCTIIWLFSPTKNIIFLFTSPCIPYTITSINGTNAHIKLIITVECDLIGEFYKNT